MKTLPTAEQINEFRRHLDQANYDAATLTELLGNAGPPGADTLESALEKTREVTATNALIRLFLLGATIEEAALASSFDDALQALCFEMDLIERVDGRIAATIVLIPVDEFLFASDTFRRLGSEDSHGFVLPASTHAASILKKITFRDNVESGLDIGCGCGIHALFAARHCQRVVATDISESALRYTQFNAVLNGIGNIETRLGSLFEPVAEQRFDLIVSNPPFVIGPGGRYEYRDSEMELDQFCETLVAEAPQYLNTNGHLQMLCEWAGIKDQVWEDRLSGWVSSDECDVFVLHTGSVPAAEYVRRRSGDVRSMDEEPVEADWLPYLQQRDVESVHAGIVTLRKSGGPAWFQTLSISGEPGDTASFALRRCFDARDFLRDCVDDESILAATLQVSPKVASEPRLALGQTRPESVMLRRGDGLPVFADVDIAVMVFLQQFDGNRTLAEAIEAFSELTGTETKNVQSELVAAARLFVTQGFLEPV